MPLCPPGRLDRGEVPRFLLPVRNDYCSTNIAPGGGSAPCQSRPKLAGQVVVGVENHEDTALPTKGPRGALDGPLQLARPDNGLTVHAKDRRSHVVNALGSSDSPNDEGDARDIALAFDDAGEVRHYSA